MVCGHVVHDHTDNFVSQIGRLAVFTRVQCATSFKGTSMSKIEGLGELVFGACCTQVIAVIYEHNMAQQILKYCGENDDLPQIRPRQ